MFPLRDDRPTFTPPAVTTLLIAACVLVFFYELTLDEYSRNYFITLYGLVPSHFRPSALITSMFLHGGWSHIIGNMLFLWAFGKSLEDAMGHGKFLAFYLAVGAIAGIVQVVLNYYTSIPTVGASGAIAGVMGAYLVKFPRAHIRTLVFVLFFVTTFDIPAVALLLYWFVIQLFSGYGSIAHTHVSDAGVAWFAHIGGFRGGHGSGECDGDAHAIFPAARYLLALGAMPDIDILAIAAHPDDVEQTCGGALLRMAEAGYRTGILDLTAGDMGTRGTPEIRVAESADAARVLKAGHRENLYLPDARLENSLAARTALALRIRELRPRTVILPYWEGRHPDHYRASQLGYEACFLAGLKKIDPGTEPHRPRKIVYASAYAGVMHAAYTKSHLTCMVGHKLSLASSKSRTFDSISHTPSRARSPGLSVRPDCQRCHLNYVEGADSIASFSGRLGFSMHGIVLRSVRVSGPTGGRPMVSRSDETDRSARAGNPRSPSRRGRDTYGPDRVLRSATRPSSGPALVLSPSRSPSGREDRGRVE